MLSKNCPVIGEHVIINSFENGGSEPGYVKNSYRAYQNLMM